MNGRRPKPAHMYKAKNDPSKRTKKEIKERQDHTVIIGGKDFHAPKSVRKDPVAKAKWLEIMQLYAESDLDITTKADVGLLERYSIAYSEYQELLDLKETIAEKYAGDPIAKHNMLHHIRYSTKMKELTNILMRMDEQLFLTPLSKCRAIPRGPKQDKKKDALKDKGFNL